MTSEQEHEQPLSPAEVREILKICAGGLLVGGQALAFWADFLAVALPPMLSSGVSADADFIGDAALARKLARALRWNVWVPSMDDATPHTAKVSKRAADGGIKQVDFLSRVAGLDTRALERRAVEVEVPEIGRLRVIHPIDVLESRIQNLYLLAEKRTKGGVAQALLAVEVARAFIRRMITVQGERTALALLERVVTIAAETAGLRVYSMFGVEPLNAVPLEDFRTTAALHSVRWPQVLADIAAKRKKLRATADGRKNRPR